MWVPTPASSGRCAYLVRSFPLVCHARGRVFCKTVSSCLIYLDVIFLSFVVKSISSSFQIFLGGKWSIFSCRNWCVHGKRWVQDFDICWCQRAWVVGVSHHSLAGAGECKWLQFFFLAKVGPFSQKAGFSFTPVMASWFSRVEIVLVCLFRMSDQFSEIFPLFPLLDYQKKN